ncbi:uncharacterized protein MELLADRAFT_90501 [Melampsora larici-populina 98AG31]|uniref:Uncharacterized protein n=1 Tax=Melampsora larici-populina (strain 98AG31 / pathotype 3-4-7) TaxID=747676 RepID=F4RX48_MELLP|nr:uncharacterized protein MELLADRAFT_90501 [Melampsora larici-populina 98AG31]EGG02902.1 hypothetical protein MELLADRAFT_90501 [Melampsora larici-populina 98AG31]
MDFEEDLRESQAKLTQIRQRRRGERTEADLNNLASLPGLIIYLEEEIEEVVIDLGSERFRNLPEASDDKGKSLIRIRVAKQNLYEAKVGVIEHKRRWDERGQGTKIQDRMKTIMTNKQALLKKKWQTYHDMTIKFNETYPSPNPLELKSFDDVKGLDISDDFWNFGELQHPQERWAVDQPTQVGIRAFLAIRSCDEELRRIAKEVTSLVRKSLGPNSNVIAIGFGGADHCTIQSVLILLEPGWNGIMIYQRYCKKLPFTRIWATSTTRDLLSAGGV